MLNPIIFRTMIGQPARGMLPNAPNSLSGTTGHIKSAYSMVQDTPSFVLRNTNSAFTGHLAEIEGTVDAHQTKSIHDIVIRNPIASKLFCALFDVGSTHKHIAALRIVTGLLERSNQFCESFRNISEKHSGFLIILYLLTKQAQKWSTDTFHVLIEPLTVSIGRAGVSEEGLRWIFTLAMDMLYFAQDDDILFGRVVEMIVDVILLNEDKGLVFLDSQPFGGSGKGSTLFIIASLMHELKKRHEEHLIPPKIVRSSSFADSVLFSQLSIERDSKKNHLTVFAPILMNFKKIKSIKWYFHRVCIYMSHC